MVRGGWRGSTLLGGFAARSHRSAVVKAGSAADEEVPCSQRCVSYKRSSLQTLVALAARSGDA